MFFIIYFNLLLYLFVLCRISSSSSNNSTYLVSVYLLFICSYRISHDVDVKCIWYIML